MTRRPPLARHGPPADHAPFKSHDAPLGWTGSTDRQQTDAKARMPDPKELVVSYARQPTRTGDTVLRARLCLPATGAGPFPLVIWIHAGGFRSGSFLAPSHTRMGRVLCRNGYAAAFVEYRLRTKKRFLSPASLDLLPHLVADAKAHSPDINPAFIGSRAIAAVEDVAAFFAWLRRNGRGYRLSDHYVMGGSSAGAMTTLNALHLGERLGLSIPPISSAILLSGAFAYPSFFTRTDTRLLALHGTRETQIPIAPIRRYALRAGDRMTLLEHPGHHHGDPRVTRDEGLRPAYRRMLRFDRGLPFRTGGARMAPTHGPRLHLVASSPAPIRPEDDHTTPLRRRKAAE